MDTLDFQLFCIFEIFDLNFYYVQHFQEKIKKRCIPYEINSNVLTSEYLLDIENIYKHDYLKDVITHSHVLVYDWTNEGDICTIVEDMEMLNFDYDKKDKKMSDWRFETVQELRTKRELYANRYFLHADYMRNETTVPELHYTAEQDEERYKMMLTVCIYNTGDLFTIKVHQLYIYYKLIFNHITVINYIYTSS